MPKERPSSRKIALVIGINNYEGEPLAYCEADALEIAEMLSEPEYGFDVSLLLNEDATKTSIRSTVARLLAEPASQFLFYFAGHGVKDRTGVYLMTHDGVQHDFGLPIANLGTLIGSPQCTTSIAILDCCYAGAVRSSHLPASRASSADIRQAAGTLGQSIAFIAAATDSQTASEHVDLGHGLFTGHILYGLYGEASDPHGDVTPSSLYSYVARAFDSADSQTPVFKADITGETVLGTGFAQRIGTGTATEPHEIANIENQAETLLDNYQEMTAVRFDMWKESGWLAAAQALEEILNWFEKNLREHPELAQKKRFTDYHRAALQRLKHLGTLDTGTRVRYGRIVEMIGSGAFGTVWKTTTEAPSESERAYKVYHSADLDKVDKISRFRRGWRAMRLLDHPNIVTVFEYTDAPVGFFMEYVDGPNLRALGAAHDGPDDAIDLLLTVGDALKHAHARDVIHRDIKPENIVLSFDDALGVWTPSLTDFDLAWFSTATQLTRAGIGAPLYAAPEQLEMPDTALSRKATVDVFSFAKLAYFVLATRDPSLSVSRDVDHLERHLRTWGNGEAVQGFIDWYRVCSSADASRRPQKIEDAVEELRGIIDVLRNFRTNQMMDVKPFLEEVGYRLGATAHGELPNIGFRTRSGRTTIALHVRKAGHSNRVTVARLDTQGAVGMTNLSGGYQDARMAYNRRLDTRIRRYRDSNRTGKMRIRRRSGGTGDYRAILEFSNFQMNSNGVSEIAHFLVQAIDVMES